MQMTLTEQAATLAFVGYSREQCADALREVHPQLSDAEVRRITDSAYSASHNGDTPKED